MVHVHITFPLDQFHATVAAFEAQFEAHSEEVTMLDFGSSQKQAVGYLVLEWSDEVDEAFIQQLAANSNILDFCVFTVPCSTDDPPCYPFTFAGEGDIRR
jgi:hypothetical protein